MEKENEKKTNNSVEELIDAINRRNQIISDDEYMQWLYDFSEEYPRFTDDTWLYNKKGITGGDWKQVRRLSDFYNGISHYHIKNLLKPTIEDGAKCYTIKYKDKYFTIGLFVGQGAICFALLHSTTPKKYVIFENIMNDVEDKDFLSKSKYLIKLQNIIIDLKSKDIDPQVIKSMVNSVLDD